MGARSSAPLKDAESDVPVADLLRKHGARLTRRGRTLPVLETSEHRRQLTLVAGPLPSDNAFLRWSLTPVAPNESAVRLFVDCFNQRRLDAAAALFAPDAVITPVSNRPFERGGAGLMQLAGIWLAAFPDATLTVEDVISRDERFYEAQLAGSGTHAGVLDLGSLSFRPTGVAARLNLRALFEVRDGLITYCSLSFDVQELVEQLTIVDSAKILEHVERIRKEGERLAAARGHAARCREIVQRLGFEIDAARQAIRPYFKR